MKGLIVVLFACITLGGWAQQADSLKRSDTTPHIEKSTPTADQKESFGDYVQKVGLGIWGRVKERFSLESVVENLEEKKNKFMGDKDKKADEDKDKKSQDPQDKKEKAKEDG